MIYNGSFATPQKAFDWWKQSSIHNGIMISESYHEIGVGIAHSSEGRIYYTVNVGMIPDVTTLGAMSYRAPSVDEYKPVNEGIEIVTSAPGADGSIYHTYKQGETLPAIAVAYGITLENLRTLNDLSASDTPADGQLLVIKLPDPTQSLHSHRRKRQPPLRNQQKMSLWITAAADHRSRRGFSRPRRMVAEPPLTHQTAECAALAGCGCCWR